MPKNAEFDVVVYGASGFTGRLVAEYLQATYGGSDLKWAMAGRNAAKLAEVRTEMGVSDGVPLIEADSADPASMDAMAERAKVVITTVGPYLKYGEPLVAACAKAGTDYVDLSGEPPFMASMIEKYNEAAKASGARIVHSCGFDSVPFDMGVWFLQEAAKAKFGNPVARVRGRVRMMKGTFSGGTAASGAETTKLAMSDPKVMAGLLNPFSLAEGFEGPKQPTGAKPIEDEALGSWAAPFVMAVINTKNIHRSNYLMGHPYGEDFVYDEMILTGPGEKGKAIAEGLAKAPPMGSEKDAPKPGEGPSKAEREAGMYDLLFHGTSADGQVIMAGVKGDRDPGYGSTSKMLAECALCLLDEAKGAKGGVLTPAPVFGGAIIDRLEAKAGLTFKIEG
ncbi:MAG: saccharopine dehydrogenase NADP-binding domain-containing protein [Pseudomonadota bacterium]